MNIFLTHSVQILVQNNCKKSCDFQMSLVNDTYHFQEYNTQKARPFLPKNVVSIWAASINFENSE